MAKKQKSPLVVETLKHDEATRKNIPTAEFHSVLAKAQQTPIRAAYERRNKDLDPQLVWRGKDSQDWSDLVVHASPVYIQEKVHPKALIDDLRRQSEEGAKAQVGGIADMFADFNGVPEGAKTDFYQHEAHWANRMILGDALQVMASLAEREGLRGKVQCVYIDPPYGIKFNSNFQWSTTNTQVKDGDTGHITREPEQVKAFRDTWRDGIHSYLAYLRDRLTVARDLLTQSGSIFVQIGDENLHLIRSVLDEVFGSDNFCSVITFRKTSGANSPHAKVNVLASVTDYIVWYARDISALKYRQPYLKKEFSGEGGGQYRWIEREGEEARGVTASEAENIDQLIGNGARILRPDNLVSAGFSQSLSMPFTFEGRDYDLPPNSHWKTTVVGLDKLVRARRIVPIGKRLYYKRYIDDFSAFPLTNIWTDVGSSGFSDPRVYVVQTVSKVIERCLQMATDPGDLVLDPTCGSGTTAYVAEQWGRRWITIDTSRVALALARARIMGARYPYYLLADSRDGQMKEADISRAAPSSQPTRGDIRLGFVYERVPHITLKSIANDAEIDVIWDKYQQLLAPALANLNKALEKKWNEWDVPRDASSAWSDAARKSHAEWWQHRIKRQKEIDASIAAKAEAEFLYDKPYEDKRRVRVAGPFTVESLSPHRVLCVDENDELVDRDPAQEPGGAQVRDFVQIILENLKAAGVQQAHKEDKVVFTSLTPWPGDLVCAEGRYMEGGAEKRAAIFIGPEFGTVSRPDLVEAAREAGDAGFDVLIACAFSYDAHSAELTKLGRVPVLKARMNADLHMAEDLKNTGRAICS